VLLNNQAWDYADATASPNVIGKHFLELRRGYELSWCNWMDKISTGIVKFYILYVALLFQLMQLHTSVL
jgi:hypothetical protein